MCEHPSYTLQGVFHIFAILNVEYPVLATCIPRGSKGGDR